MKLSIAEGLYLIALDDEEGRLLAAAEKTYIDAVLSAVILELYILKKITLTDSVIKVVDTTGTGNLVMDKVLHKLHSGQRFLDEIQNLHDYFKDVKDDLDELLVHRGILRREETKLLWIPLSERMDNANYAFEQEIRNMLQAMVFKSAKAPQAFIILLSLIFDCGIIDEVFKNKDDLIDAVKVAKDIINSPELEPEVARILGELRSYFGK
ncbi:MAG: GPP34 family phosphoprotein [Cyclobacteriaceae bacterium]|nr:GPP34 family phosphoprotein [Cyclobacteriaceae bacterium]